MIVWLGPAFSCLWATDLCLACQFACASDFFQCDCLCPRPWALSHLLGSSMWGRADDLKKALPMQRKLEPFPCELQEERHRAVEIHWWSLFPSISMSWDRKDGSETKSGNQRPTLSAFWYKPRRSLKILDSNNLVGGYDCIFVIAGD